MASLKEKVNPVCRETKPQIIRLFKEEKAGDNHLQSILDSINNNSKIIDDEDESTMCKKTELHHHTTNNNNYYYSNHEQKEPFNFIETAEQIAFRIPLIQSEIVNRLDFEDLKEFRLLNSSWNSICTKEILKRDVCSMSFRFMKKSNDNNNYYYHHSKFKNKKISLVDMIQIIQNSSEPNLTTTFPCTNFRFIGGDLGHEDVQHFFSHYGQKMRTLWIHPGFGPRYTDQTTLINILTNLLPHLQSLSIGHFPLMKWTESNQLSFPFLTELTCEGTDFGQSTAFSMVARAPKLESVFGFDVNFVPNFLSKFPILTIKDVQPDFGIDSVENVNNIWNFAQAQPKLEMMALHHGDPPMDDKMRQKIVTSLNKILESSKDSLVKLDMEPFGRIPGISLPIMKNLKTLILTHDDYSDPTSMFPKGTVPAQIFPGVETIMFWHEMGGHWNSYFGDDEDGFKKLKEINIEITKDHNYFLYQLPISKSFFQELVIRCPSFTDFNLDKQLLTGLTAGETDGVNILSCKGLQKIKFILEDDKLFLNGLESNFKLFSEASVLHGFQLMNPNFEVTISFDHHHSSAMELCASIQAVMPQAKIIHEDSI